jgi:Cd2+/Zn2+-exporting ATPase
VSAKQKKELINIVAIASAFLLAILLNLLTPLPDYISIPLYVVLYVAIGFPIIKEAVTNIFHGRVFDENFLMTIATIGAFFIGEYADAVAVMLLYQIGEFFQRYAVGKSRKSISELMDITPETATVVRDGEHIVVAPEEVAVGETIVIKAGERVPLDGVILEGTTTLDTSMLTGESLPRDVGVGESVMSGTINLSGVIYVQTTSLFQNSTVSRILELVETASDSKAPAENFITKFSRYYTPIVVVLAALLFLVPSIFTGLWAVWGKRAMMFLFVSCPCALVISVPMSFFGGIGACSRSGILVKGSNFLEMLAKVDTVVMDKTGTITHGKFAVTEVIPAEKREEILHCASICESMSNHPIAKSITAACAADASGYQHTEFSGRGILAKCSETVLLAGNMQLLIDNDVECVPVDAVGTVVYVAKDGQYLGAIVVADTVKEDSTAAVMTLKSMNIDTLMLTGDNEQTAKAVANAVGVDAYKSQLLPEDKVAAVNELLDSKHIVAFVGDGINDAPVLVASSVGISMGTLGSDSAIEASDIVLVNDKLSDIVKARKVAKKTLGIVTQNIVFALAVKFAVLLLSALGSVDNLILAILADVGVAVLAILNAMRVMGKTRTRTK